MKTNARPLIPHVTDVMTGAVRVPVTIERNLSKLIGRPVHIRTQKDLAKTLAAALPAAALAMVVETAERALKSRKPTPPDEPKK